MSLCFQETPYSFIQESQIDMESPAHMDPAVVAVSSFAPPQIIPGVQQIHRGSPQGQAGIHGQNEPLSIQQLIQQGQQPPQQGGHGMNMQTQQQGMVSQHQPTQPQQTLPTQMSSQVVFEQIERILRPLALRPMPMLTPLLTVSQNAQLPPMVQQQSHQSQVGNQPQVVSQPQMVNQSHVVSQAQLFNHPQMVTQQNMMPPTSGMMPQHNNSISSTHQQPMLQPMQHQAYQVLGQTVNSQALVITKAVAV
jgi:hypothetical protein